LDTEERQTIAYCKLSVASLRVQAAHTSNIRSQVLFGEKVHLIRKKSREWMKVKCDWDGVEGWVDPKQFYFDENKNNKEASNCQTFALDHMHVINSENISIPIIIGSDLLKCDGLNVKMPFGKFQYGGQIIDLNQSSHSRKLLIKIAMRYLHAPYSSGGRSILGTDSTGFIQLAYKMIGISLPRFSQDMVKNGTDVGFINEANPGDIAFFENKESEITHAGLVLENNQILHVHGNVRIDFLDQQGIYVKRRRSYLYNLRTIRQYI